MVTKSFLLATALAVGTMAQTTSVMNLFLDTAEGSNITLLGSVISAAPDATTYSVTSLLDESCTDVRRTRPVMTVPNLTLESRSCADTTQN
jgi:hypothetical protein